MCPNGATCLSTERVGLVQSGPHHHFKSGLEQTIYRPQGAYANHYITEAVYKIIDL
jgi:hypothetical protein